MTYMYVNVWFSCGGVAHSFCTAMQYLSELENVAKIDDVDRLVAMSSLVAIGSTLPYLQLCHSSTHPSTSLHMMNFTRPSPALVLQSTNAGVRKSGYEARFMEG